MYSIYKYAYDASKYNQIIHIFESLVQKHFDEKNTQITDTMKKRAKSRMVANQTEEISIDVHLIDGL